MVDFCRPSHILSITTSTWLPAACQLKKGIMLSVRFKFYRVTRIDKTARVSQLASHWRAQVTCSLASALHVHITRNEARVPLYRLFTRKSLAEIREQL